MVLSGHHKICDFFASPKGVICGNMILGSRPGGRFLFVLGDMVAGTGRRVVHTISKAGAGPGVKKVKKYKQGSGYKDTAFTR